MTLPRTWLLLFAFIAVFLAVTVGRDSFQTNIFSLLPDVTDKQLPLDVLDKYSEKLSRRVAFLVYAENTRHAQQLTTSLALLLENSRLFESVEYRYSRERMASLFKMFHAYRFALISPVDAQQLEQGGAGWLAQRVLNALVSPVSGTGTRMLQQDPFGLLSGYISSLPRLSRHATVNNGFITFGNDGKEYLLVSATLNGSAFDLSFQDQYQQLENKIDNLLKKNEGTQIHGYGILYYAIQNRLIAQNEMGWIGSVSLFAIFVLFVYVFRRASAFFFIILPVATGAICALAASLAIFGEIHLIALIFGASLIGVSIDYTFHYCCANSNLTTSQHGRFAINLIRTSLTLGLLTSVAGYLTLATTDFPSLRQMAVFSAAGLVGTYLAVVFWLPYLVRKPFVINASLVNLIGRSVNSLNRQPAIPGWLIVLSLALILTAVYVSGEARDDIRLMRTDLPELDRRGDFFRQIIKESPNSQYFVVSGNNPLQLMQRERELVQKINALRVENAHIQSVSQWLLPRLQQEHNYRLLSRHISNNHELDAALEKLGLPVDMLDTYRADLANAKGHYLSLDQFLQSDASTFVRDLWVGRKNENYYSIVSLYGFADISALKDLTKEQQGVFFVDRAGAVSRLMHDYRVSVQNIAPIILLVLFVMLAMRYKVQGALRVIGVPVLAAMMSLFLTQLLQGSYNLFNLFGMVISIAVAIDYAIFMRESAGHRNASLLAIYLAGLSTMISLGVLALSRTPALNSFGLTLLLGIVLSLFFTTIVVRPQVTQE